MADNALDYSTQRDKVASCDSICMTCPAAVACSTAKAELQEKKIVHVCYSALFAERGCLSCVHEGFGT